MTNQPINAPRTTLMDEIDDLYEQQFDDPAWPEMMPCYTCKPVDGVMRKVLGEGPVTNRADPTQTYRLECGHLAI